MWLEHFVMVQVVPSNPWLGHLATGKLSVYPAINGYLFHIREGLDSER